MAPVELSSVTVFAPGSGSRSDPGRVVVRLLGEHDAFTAAAFSDAMAQAVALEDADLVVDLRDLEFMGVATADVIRRTRAVLRRRSRSLVLRGPPPFAVRLLEVCGLADLVEVRPVEPAPPSAQRALGTWVTVPATDRGDRGSAAAGRTTTPGPPPRSEATSDASGRGGP